MYRLWFGTRGSQVRILVPRQLKISVLHAKNEALKQFKAFLFSDPENLFFYLILHLFTLVCSNVC
jgi:cell division protein FtsB